MENDKKTKKILDKILLHITDEKPITARQCIKALPNIAIRCPKCRKKIIASLKAADFSHYKDSMRPLLESDRNSTLNILLKHEHK